MFRGLKAMGLAGTSPRALLFLAFDGQGDVQLAVADQGDALGTAGTQTFGVATKGIQTFTGIVAGV